MYQSVSWRTPRFTMAPPDLADATGTTGSTKVAASTMRSASSIPPCWPPMGE